MHTLLMFVVDVQSPRRTQDPFNANTGLQCVRGVIVWVDHCTLFIWRQQTVERFVDCTKSINPPVLIQIIVEQANAAADNRLCRTPRRICKAEPRSEGPAII